MFDGSFCGMPGKTVLARIITGAVCLIWNHVFCSSIASNSSSILSLLICFFVFGLVVSLAVMFAPESLFLVLLLGLFYRLVP
jgi:hypothetical protein